MDEATRFWSKVDKTGDCWIFDGTLRADGYRSFGAGLRRTGNRRSVLAHRYAYEATIGPIPAGMQVDHDCHNRDQQCAGGPTCLHRSCVRPEHLIARTGRDNVIRGKTAPARNVAKTHCLNGHPFDRANTRIYGTTRQCRACDRDAARRWREANPEKTREINRRADRRRSEKRKGQREQKSPLHWNELRRNQQ